MTLEQMAGFKKGMAIAGRRGMGQVRRPYRAADRARSLSSARRPFNAEGRRRTEAPAIAIPAALPGRATRKSSTQAGFGKILNAIAARTASCRAASSRPRPTSRFRPTSAPGSTGAACSAIPRPRTCSASSRSCRPQLWRKTPRGQHIELGIAENNLFIQLAALGLSHEIFGTRLLPIGTLYDPFIARGLDALNYACYQDARFMIVATPSGVTLRPRRRASEHPTPLIGIGQPGLLSYEPAYVDELAVLLRFGLEHMQQPQGLLDLPAPLDPQPGAARAYAVGGPTGRHRERRLLVRRTRAGRRHRHRVHGRRHAGAIAANQSIVRTSRAPACWC
jgi:pyruvate dehydrogenase E1 component